MFANAGLTSMSEFLVSITEWHLKLWLNSFLIFESQAVDLKFSLKLIDGFMVLSGFCRYFHNNLADTRCAVLGVFIVSFEHISHLVLIF